MARMYEVTRTVENTEAVALVFNKTTAEAENIAVIVPGRHSLGDKKLIKLVEKTVTDPDLKFIEVVEATPHTKCYGITFSDFMRCAVELDPKTRQPAKI